MSMSLEAASSMSPPTSEHHFSPHRHRRMSLSSLCLQSSSIFRRNTLRYSILNFVSFMFLPNMASIIMSRHRILLCMPTSEAFLQRSFLRLSRHSSICGKWAYVRKLLVPGPPPFHLVKKDDGNQRPCGAYCCLGMITEPNHYFLPNMADVTSSLHGAQVFSKLDLLKGYTTDIFKKRLDVYLAANPRLELFAPV